MADKFNLIYFTPPTGTTDEQSERIRAALTFGGFDFAHLRMPGASEATLREVVEGVEPALRSRITLHDHFNVAEAYGCGVQINSRNPSWPGSGRTSASCHSLPEAELLLSKGCNFVTLSPIFPSISKKGYQADFSDLNACPPGIIALGGVTPEKLPELRKRQFSGAAILGWLDVPLPEFYRRLRRLKMLAREEFRLQYITNSATGQEVIAEVAAVLSGGCRWIQIRMKDATDSEVSKTALEVVKMCRKSGAICLLDDRVHLVETTGVDGVHLGKNDMSPIEARRILGESKIIGSTANSLDDITRIVTDGNSDYIGCGPFRFTTTKKHLAPVLGIDGYHKIYATAEGRALPIVAIGGIEKEDIGDILNAGAAGVAVSGAIFRAGDRKKATREFIEKIKLHI